MNRRSVLSLLVGVLALSVCSCHRLTSLRRGDRDVSVAVIQRAAAVEDPRLLEPLLALLERREGGDLDRTLYYQAMAAALVVGDRQDLLAVPVLIRLLSDPAPALRRNVVEALALLGGPEVDAALRRCARTDPDAWVREHAAGFLEEAGGTAASTTTRGGVEEE